MGTITFVGKVVPVEVNLGLNTGAVIHWEVDPDAGVNVDFSVDIKNSLVTVDCSYTGNLTQEHIPQLYMRAFDLARAHVDLFSFANGVGLTVVLEKIVDRVGTSTGILPQDLGLAPLCTAFNMNQTDLVDFKQVLKLAIENPAIFMAVNDLIVAITYPHYAPVNCARAIEGVRHLLAPNQKRDKQWPIMLSALRLERSYIDPIMDASKSGRHGDRTHIPGPTLNQIVQRSWSIMSRFLEFKKRDAGDLPANEFPTLCG